MSDGEKKTEKVTVEDLGKWAKWFADNKRWIYPTILFVVGYFGGNPDNVSKWLPNLDNLGVGTSNEVVERVDKLEENVDVLTKAVSAHEAKLFPLGQPADASSRVDEADKPLHRE